MFASFFDRDDGLAVEERLLFLLFGGCGVGEVFVTFEEISIIVGLDEVGWSFKP